RWPLRSTAVKATWRPSGEIASNFSREEKLELGGGAMVSRSKAGLELVLCKVKNAPRPSVTKVSRPAAIHQGLGVAAGCGVSVAEIPQRLRPPSWTACQRSSGFLASAVRIRRSSSRDEAG